MRIQFGEELEVLSNGPLIAPETLRGMGVSDGTTCWGVWMSGDGGARNPVKMKNEFEIPHLMVSPLHPSVWPISFQIRVMLRDEKRSLSNFLTAIEHLPIEIQFSEYSFVGYEQMELNLLCTFSDLSEWKTDFLTFYKKQIESSKAPNLNSLWSAKQSKSATANAIDDIARVLRISSSKLSTWKKEKPFRKQKTKDAYDDNAIRRTALEWIGRRMLRRLAAMWLTVWTKHYEEFGLPLDELIRNSNENLDPVGDYFFPGKSVELGRKPWNIELPLPASWHKDNQLLNYKRGKRQAWEKLWALWDKPTSFWFPDGPDNKSDWIAEAEAELPILFEKVTCSTDLEYQRRTSQRRMTKDALLAHYCVSENEWMNNVCERILSRNWLHPYTSHCCYELAYAAIWGSEKLEPIELVYDESLGQLRTKNDQILNETFQSFENEIKQKVECSGDSFPEVALASFNVKERFFRIRFISPNDKRIFSVEIDFEVFDFEKRQTRIGELEEEFAGEKSKGKLNEAKAETAEDHDKRPRPTARGLLQMLCKVAGDLHIDLLRVSVDQKGRYRRGKKSVIEDGRITLVGKTNSNITESDQAHFKACFDQCLEEDEEIRVRFRDYIELSTEVNPWQTKTVFWSSIIEHNKHKELFKIATDACKKYGMNLVKMQDIVCSLESRKSTTTPEVVKKIQNADAVIQLVCLRESDKEKVLFQESWHPEYVWMHSEYAVAHTLGKPIVRLLDASMPYPIRDQFDKYNRDEFIDSIDLRWANAAIQDKLESVAAELRSRLSNSRA